MRLIQILSAAVSVSILSYGVVQSVMAQEPDEVPVSALASVRPRVSTGPVKPKVSALESVNASANPGIDTLVNFNGPFTAPGYDPFGNFNESWYYTMVGHSPDNHGPTILNAPIIPVSLDLRNADGSPRYVNGQRLYSDAKRYAQPVLVSRHS